MSNIFLGVILNSIAFLTLLKRPNRNGRTKRRTSELYLLHICFNDLLFSIGLIPQVLNDAICKYYYPNQSLSVVNRVSAVEQNFKIEHFQKLHFTLNLTLMTKMNFIFQNIFKYAEFKPIIILKIDILNHHIFC
jgi:hypothetical protein